MGDAMLVGPYSRQGTQVLNRDSSLLLGQHLEEWLDRAIVLQNMWEGVPIYRVGEYADRCRIDATKQMTEARHPDLELKAEKLQFEPTETAAIVSLWSQFSKAEIIRLILLHGVLGSSRSLSVDTLFGDIERMAWEFEKSMERNPHAGARNEPVGAT